MLDGKKNSRFHVTLLFVVEGRGTNSPCSLLSKYRCLCHAEIGALPSHYGIDHLPDLAEYVLQEALTLNLRFRTGITPCHNLYEPGNTAFHL